MLALPALIVIFAATFFKLDATPFQIMLVCLPIVILCLLALIIPISSYRIDPLKEEEKIHTQELIKLYVSKKELRSTGLITFTLALGLIYEGAFGNMAFFIGNRVIHYDKVLLFLAVMWLFFLLLASSDIYESIFKGFKNKQRK